MNKAKFRSWYILIIVLFILSSCSFGEDRIDLKTVEYTQNPYITVNKNKPEFSKEDITIESFEQYSELDDLGRCGVAVACIGKDLMPTEERGPIGQVRPSGWHLDKYDIVDGKYLYNRCHLIGYQLSGENANEKNLITGTRYMNTEGMLPFENKVAHYVKQTNNHVIYRATPIYFETDLLAKGVQLEAFSVEDDGAGISFNVFVFNVQPGIDIDYSDGSSRLIAENEVKTLPTNSEQTESVTDEKGIIATDSTQDEIKTESTYILNTNTHKIHYPDCPSVSDIKGKNKKEYSGSKEDLLNSGYTACERCKP